MTGDMFGLETSCNSVNLKTRETPDVFKMTWDGRRDVEGEMEGKNVLNDATMFRVLANVSW